MRGFWSHLNARRIRRVARWVLVGKFCQAKAIGMVFILLLLVGCDGPQRDILQLELIEPDLVWQQDTLGIQAGIALSPSPALMEALNHGVAVTVVVSTRVHPWHGLLANTDQTRNHRFEIRYLPLIEHYQLTELKTEEVELYPRLSMLLQGLATPRWMDTQLTTAQQNTRGFHVQVRVDIDRERLPAPMQLSAWRDDQWRSRQDWQTWRMISTDSR